MDPTVLYRIAALPDEIAATLTPDTLLTDPRTGRQVSLKEMSARSLDRALDALEGRMPPEKPKPPSGDVTLTGKTREEFAADALRIMGRLSEQMTGIRGRKGSLTGDSKQRVLAAIENLRRIVLKWPAWATPAAKEKPARAWRARRKRGGGAAPPRREPSAMDALCKVPVPGLSRGFSTRSCPTPPRRPERSGSCPCRLSGLGNHPGCLWRCCAQPGCCSLRRRFHSRWP